MEVNMMQNLHRWAVTALLLQMDMHKKQCLGHKWTFFLDRDMRLMQHLQAVAGGAQLRYLRYACLHYGYCRRAARLNQDILYRTILTSPS